MFGMIAKITAAPQRRETLINILLEGPRYMPGCLNYIIAKDAGNDDDIWITEVWESKAIHDASLSLPSVKDAIAKAKPMIAAFSAHAITTPVGGRGLPTA